MSKGSGRRPSELSEQEWANRWDAIFGRDEPPKQEAKDEPVKVRESRESHGHLWIDALYKPQGDK
jgi:hypothetical protein